MNFTDQLNRTITISNNPQRIISLVPSLTELLYDLCLGDRVVGITKFCVHPETWFHSKTRVGGTKNLKPDVIASLQPDLVLANKEENTQSDIEGIWEEYPVWVSDVNTLAEAMEMIHSIGELTNTTGAAARMIQTIEASFVQIAPLKPRRVLYLIWQEPWMTVGQDTFIDDMLGRCGFVSVVEGKRYPELTDQEIQGLNPEVVLLSSEPSPFQETHVARMQQLLPDAKVLLVDGEMFSWYGSRLQESAAYFQSLIADIH